MLTVEHIDVYGWEAAIRGMRNPLNSWNKSDSYGWFDCREGLEYRDRFPRFTLGTADFDLAKRLINAGSDHAKFMRMLTVTMDITAPLYWWKEFDTYKVGTVANSCSTMHKIHAYEFTLDDFSHEHLDALSRGSLIETIKVLNHNREQFISTKDKSAWWQLIQLLPTSYNQRRTIQLNYAVLRNIYHSRCNHKLDEWHTLCDAIRKLPYSELITGEATPNPCTT